MQNQERPGSVKGHFSWNTVTVTLPDAGQKQISRGPLFAFRQWTLGRILRWPSIRVTGIGIISTRSACLQTMHHPRFPRG